MKRKNKEKIKVHKICQWVRENFLESKKTVYYVNKSPHADPIYAKKGDSGFDLRAWIESEINIIDGIDGMSSEINKEIIIIPHETKIVHTGIYVELDKETELQVRSRSGCSLKMALIVLNSPGTVDEMYRGEICIIAYNAGKEKIVIKDGDRIAQAVISPVYNEGHVKLIPIQEIDKNTDRSDNGFGSTKIK